ncbi:MAG: phenylalanine--tRNA ligase subunit alpha [Candidatus Pacebacteria bacterium]|nr:phenylalanine--tRNA ligase subunit alpha [Candidatus Paceibacterota bacterium]MDD3919410.1 phenylalanine--tRNA ligase subunit alpha [Candidatus Paceibacterota bacterium]
MTIENLKNEALNKLDKVLNLEGLAIIEKEYLGKKGKIRELSSSMKGLSSEERKDLGVQLNELSNLLEEKILFKKKNFKLSEIRKKEEGDFLDITVPGKKIERGHIHPLSSTKKELEDIFALMGFSVIEGPEVEDEWHNFDALNFPLNHPAREMQDTFFIKQKERESLSQKEKFVLRTHTSNIQTRYMENHEPPIKIVAPGRVFRCEATDDRHEVCFYQIEGLYVDKNVSVANLKAVLERFLQEYFRDSKVKIRLRPSYFPFVEPGFEVDMSCLVCGQKGCSVCSGEGWLEILGGGMVHPNVFKNCGLNPKEVTGFAFGVSVDRLAMMKSRVDNIRWFHSGDLRFLKQF